MELSTCISAHFSDYFDLLSLNADYASALDSGDWDRWPDFFVDDCVYKLQPRENYDRGFPLATLSFESQRMLRDRVFGIRETLFHDPYYQRHIVGAPVIRRIEDGCIHAEANYVVLRTKPDQLTDVLNTGRYIDVVRRTADGLRFQSRHCVFDSEVIPNSLIYPI
ncbi:salicylate 5-hydroxylase small subunit [Cupriavidus sp. YR651]|uniref:aromatic-ring-hydroxylating dioxygenase subunit beta n=1 Tax=Cupriavidus sp. YR651 TaxID=1855315 RepID=UPI0008834A19|nr:aromatic-ring-hydroxylating dioxygenase subunit beta [Cupriavidus sp. YR651]SDC69794.1 salicylate 5-hydroxylase small subunit [Cupriavidus sp. YR651]